MRRFFKRFMDCCGDLQVMICMDICKHLFLDADAESIWDVILGFIFQKYLYTCIYIYICIRNLGLADVRSCDGGDNLLM